MWATTSAAAISPPPFLCLTQEFGYSNTQLGLIASLSEMAYATGKFINGPLADKIGGRKIFLVGMAGAIFFNIIFAISASLTVFIIVWCLLPLLSFYGLGWTYEDDRQLVSKRAQRHCDGLN